MDKVANQVSETPRTQAETPPRAVAVRDRAAEARIRVLLIAPSLEILGGQAVQAARLLSNLQGEPGVEISFLPMNPAFWGPFRLLKFIKYVRTISTYVVFLCKLLVRLPKCDIVHVFTAAYYSFLLAPAPALVAARLFGKKSILNYRDGQAEDHLKNWRTAIPLIRFADRIVVPSGFLVDVFRKFNIHTESIPNFIEPGRFRFRERWPLRPVFLHNRILEPLYDVGCTLRAFAIVQRRCPEARLTVSHEGVCRPDLEALAHELKLRNVEFIGKVPQDRIAELYDSADIYLTSPVIDNMPGSLLECFVSGLPLVATKAGGIPYMVTDQETGLLVPCGDHEAMAAAVFRLLEDEALVKKITRQGREECKRYSWPEVREKWLGLYEELSPRRRQRKGM